MGNIKRREQDRGLVVHTEYPFGKDALRSDGSQWSDEVSDAAGSTAAWVDVESITIDPPDNGGTIVEVELGVTWAQKSDDTEQFVNGRIVGRNKDGTWVVLVDTGTSPAAGNPYIQNGGATDATTYQEHTYSGRFETETNFSKVPFDIAVQIQREDTTGTVTGKVKNSSYITVKYR